MARTPDPGATAAAGSNRKKAKKEKEMATIGETFGFVFGSGPKVTLLWIIGFVAGIMNGLVYPALAYFFSRSFSDLSGASSNGISAINNIAFTFMGIGGYALATGLAQNWAFEIVAYHSSQNFRLKYFRSLLRQDQAFYDVYDVGGIASQVEANANRFRRGVGRKFGEGIEFATTGIGGLAYALYSSWRVALVVLSVVPIVSLAALFLMSLNQKKGVLTAKAYKQAGGVAYSAVASVKTVLSLNAVRQMVELYKAATLAAFKDSVSFVLKQGIANGSMLGSFLFLYCILTLYGTSLLYKDVRADGCDPSSSVMGNETCANTGAAVFGAMLGVAFAAQGVSQVGNMTEAFADARVAVFEALVAMSRTPGAPQKILYKSPGDDELGSTTHSISSKRSRDVEAGEEREVRAILPKFEIDSTARSGLKPNIRGRISFQNVRFSYPTRPMDTVLDSLSFDVEAGETCALVGPSGSGKSSTVLLLERFYDPTGGRILIDGVDVKDINVGHLRGSIGYVGQEPALFATTIRGNIQYGNPDATQEQIEEAARLANAHDFITSLTDGYDTQVGDAGSMLSGGQKQRISLARVLVGDPKILLLDEATSALDAESELVVQEALDNILEKKKITTIIIAHRLSTIRNADKINVIVSGQVRERGTHDELMSDTTYYRRLVEKQEGANDEEQRLSRSSSRGSFLDNGQSAVVGFQARPSSTPHLEFKGVTFCYPSRPQKKVLDGFSLSIHQGETVALVGPSGGGKSTTVGLIERFYDVTSGELNYLGVDVRSLNVSWYRTQLSYVGQEPTLFNMTIAENIAFGAEGVSRADIEEAARQANAHDFIVEFPQGYDTPVGASKSNTGLSGGQKQRIAIARALVRKPRVLVLDEATSALDNESEAIVQEAIDKLMQSRDHTVVVIAHRLSTIRNADRIALIADGKVAEYGSHEELIDKPNGRYKRLFESSKRRSTVESVGLRKSNLTISKIEEVEQEEEVNWEEKIREEEQKAFSVARARRMARPDLKYMFVGAVGAVISGGVFPTWGILLSETINLLFTRVSECPNPLDGSIPGSFPSCQDYTSSTADTMRSRSFEVAGYWAGLFVASIVGNILNFWGFGTASERLNKRLRDSSFLALMRQEVAFFDKRSVGSITSQLQDDAARIHSFSGEPIRTTIVALGSVMIGVIISLFFMWPLALVTIGCIPIMAFATSVRMKRMVGEEDEMKTDKGDALNSPAGIVVETLLNMRTVSALVLEDRRFKNYEEALMQAEPRYRYDAFMAGLTGGLSLFIQQWVNALQFWFGGWLLIHFQSEFTFNDFLIAQFSILFSLFGLGSAFTNISDRSEVEKSAGRVFYLLDRESEIDPLSTEGKKLTGGKDSGTLQVIYV